MMAIFLKSAMADLRNNFGRTVLTSLGILIGVLAVVLLIAFGLGLKTFITQQFQKLGTDLIFVFPGRIFGEGGTPHDREGFGSSITFDEKDIQSLRQIDEISAIVPVFIKSGPAESGGNSMLADIYLTTADIFFARNLTPQEGSMFTETDVAKRSKKAVVGAKVAEELF